MFTGIVEEIGTIADIQRGSHAIKLRIHAKKVLAGTQLGDSICTNGVCLTVTNLGKDSFEVDVMSETVNKSNLSELQQGSFVHLERALTLQSRLGGHMVSGHIDGQGEISHIAKDENATWLTVSAAAEILKYIVYKGSIAIDGVSLTVAEVGQTFFKVSIIPHTAQNTHLLQKKKGDLVNLECDMVGKYIERLLNFREEPIRKASNLTKDFLEKYNFL
nr:riboflavin synthase [uncultured Cellulosilyticum sp.]